MEKELEKCDKGSSKDDSRSKDVEKELEKCDKGSSKDDSRSKDGKRNRTVWYRG